MIIDKRCAPNLKGHELGTSPGSLDVDTLLHCYYMLKAYGWLSKLWPLLGSPIIIRHLIFRVPKKGTIILTTTHMCSDANCHRATLF